MKLNFNGPCPICGKPRGAVGVSHEKCGRILQARHKEKMKGTFTFPDGKEVTVEQKKHYKSNHIRKLYGTKKSEAYWKKFD
jgi:hypothetical protein